MNTHEVVTKLIGPIKPVGESHTDADRFINLNQMIELVDMLLFDISQVAQLHNRQEHSVKMCGERAKKWLQDLKETDVPA